MNTKLLAVALVSTLALAGAASANVYQLQFVSQFDSGTVNLVTAGDWTTPVISVSGQIDGAAVTGLSNYAFADNTLLATGPHLSLAGLSVSTALDTFNFSSYPYLIMLKHSEVPSGLLTIPGDHIIGSALNPLAGQPDQYQLNLVTSTDNGLVNFVVDTSGAITGVSGQIDGATVTGLSNYAFADNHISSTAPYATLAGISVATTADIFNFGSYPYLIMNKQSVVPSGLLTDPGTETIAAEIIQISGAPEPAAWAVMTLGFGLAGAALRRRRAGAPAAA